MLNITTLASGSAGNSALISCENTHILLDAGISAKRISVALRALGITPAQLSAVLVTHEHSDHISALPVLASKIAAPICATPLTCAAMYRKVRCDAVRDLMQEQAAGSGMQIGSLWVESFPTPHDAADSVGYSITGDDGRIVVCTDLGHVTGAVRSAVAGCDLLVCETNHDEDMVRAGPYPYLLKQRILGERGHLSNEAGAELAAWAVESGAKTVILGHLSRQNNTPERALEAVSLRLLDMGCDPERDITLSAAPYDTPGPTRTLRKAVLC